MCDVRVRYDDTIEWKVKKLNWDDQAPDWGESERDTRIKREM